MNYRDFLSRNCLKDLIFKKNLRVSKEKIVGGGNVALFLLTAGLGSNLDP